MTATLRAAIPTYAEWLTRKLGPGWYHRDKPLKLHGGAPRVCITPRRSRELEAEYEKAFGISPRSAGGRRS